MLAAMIVWCGSAAAAPLVTNTNACRRVVSVATLSLAGHAGANKIRFQGRISRSAKLKPGRYTVVISAIDSFGQRSATKTLSFVVLR